MMLDITRSEFAVMFHDCFQFPIYKRIFKRYKIVIVTGNLCACETWFIFPREQRRLGVMDDRVQRAVSSAVRESNEKIEKIA